MRFLRHFNFKHTFVFQNNKETEVKSASLEYYETKTCLTDFCSGQRSVKLIAGVQFNVADDNEPETVEVYFRFKINHTDFPLLQWMSRKYKIKSVEIGTVLYLFSAHFNNHCRNICLLFSKYFLRKSSNI